MLVETNNLSRKNYVCLLSQQKYACCDKSFVTKKLCLSRQNIFATNIILSRQNKHTSVTTSNCLSQQNMSFIMTKVCLSRQNLCCDKHMLVATNICHDNNFVMTKDVFCHGKHVFVVTKLLSWQKLYLWQLPQMIDKQINKTVIKSIYMMIFSHQGVNKNCNI